MRDYLIHRWALGFGIALILLSPNLAEAQRPSLGGLQLQINDMLSGELDFEVVSFGDECRFCLNPDLPGLIEKDPGGFRVFGSPKAPGDGAVVRFGPTDDCTIGIDPFVQGGLIFRDPDCFIFRNPLPLPPKIVLGGGILEFGPECRLRVDPTGQLTGMIEEDPAGLRLLGQNGEGCILTFGPTDLCRIRVAPDGPTGLIEEDVVGVRLLGVLGRAGDRTGAQLLFGPTDECTFGLDPEELIPGLLLRDPNGLVVSNIGSSGKDGVRMQSSNGQLVISNIGSSGEDGVSFGPTGECRIFVDPTRGGMTEADPNGFRILGDELDPGNGAVLRFGDTDECSLGIVRGLSGLVESDPGGLRLLGPGGEGCILTFGQTDLCRIKIDPQRPDDGMIFCDPRGFLFQDPTVPGEASMTVEGDIFANAFIQRSSADSKENVRTIDNALDKVKNLRGVYFDWKKEVKAVKDGESRNALGFIAEEVAEVVPEAVKFDETGKKAEGVQYANLVSLVVESVKEQQQQIEAQQEQIDDQQAQLDEQQQIIQELQAAVAEMRAMQQR